MSGNVPSNVGFSPNLPYYAQTKKSDKTDKSADTGVSFSGANFNKSDEFISSTKAAQKQSESAEIKKADEVSFTNQVKETGNVRNSVHVSKYVTPQDAKRIANNMKKFDDVYDFTSQEHPNLSDNARANVTSGALELLG